MPRIDNNKNWQRGVQRSNLFWLLSQSALTHSHLTRGWDALEIHLLQHIADETHWVQSRRATDIFTSRALRHQHSWFFKQIGIEKKTSARSWILCCWKQCLCANQCALERTAADSCFDRFAAYPCLLIVKSYKKWISIGNNLRLLRSLLFLVV